MIDLIERIGPYLGIAAFLGLAILVFLIFQQAREVRRLREWAGRAPERAGEAGEAVAAVAEARGEQAPEPEAPPEEPGRLGRQAAVLRERFGAAWAEVDRRSPFDPRYFVVVIAAAVLAGAIVTGGFGLFGGESSGGGGAGKGGVQKAEKPDKVEVSVLNGTQDDSGAVPIAGVQGLAGEVAKQVVKPAGFAIGEKTDAASGFPASVIMFEPEQAGAEEAAQELADAVEGQLGQTAVQPIVAAVSDLSGGAPVVLIVGQDDSAALDIPAPG